MILDSGLLFFGPPCISNNSLTYRYNFEVKGSYRHTVKRTHNILKRTTFRTRLSIHSVLFMQLYVFYMVAVPIVSLFIKRIFLSPSVRGHSHRRRKYVTLVCV